MYRRARQSRVGMPLTELNYLSVAESVAVLLHQKRREYLGVVSCQSHKGVQRVVVVVAVVIVVVVSCKSPSVIRVGDYIGKLLNKRMDRARGERNQIN
jgi:hypothetical protein